MRVSSIRLVRSALALAMASLAVLASSAGAVVTFEPRSDGAAAVPPSPFGQELSLLDPHLAPSERRSSPQVRSDVIPGQYIVVLKNSVTQTRRVARAQARGLGGEVGFIYSPVLNGYSVKGLSEGDAKALRRDARVRYVVADRIAEPADVQTTPTGIDRAFATANEKLRIDEADDFRVDADVAVIDSGIDYEHPDLKVVARSDCTVESVGECQDGLGTDTMGHGTHVAGTIGALDNAEGVVGVAPGARLWAVKVFRNSGAPYSWIISGVKWVTLHADEIEVANMSLGGPDSAPLNEAIATSVEAGIVYVVAAGNNTTDAKDTSPANSPKVITVSALADYDGKAGGEAAPLWRPSCEAEQQKEGEKATPDDNLAGFSNYGEVVDVAAPGTCILSTFPTSGYLLEGYETSEGYGTISGTSMASPHVAGAAALLASVDNPEDGEDVEAIRQTIEEEGNTTGIAEGGWKDTSEDGFKEPLLDVGGEAVFAPSDQKVVTGDTEILSSSEATLHGEVNPDGVATEYWFEYGTTTEYGSKAPAAGASAGSGGEYTPVEETVKGLEGQTLYHYRLVAKNETGTYYGLDREFGTTPPTVSTESATEVSANEADLNATVNPEGFPTTYRFDFGLTTSYGYSTQSGQLEAGTKAVEVPPKLLEGLEAEATYHFRVVAQNIAGTTTGEDETFTTQAADWAVQSVPKPNPEEEENRRFKAISCSTPSDCMVVGKKTSPSSPAAGLGQGLRWDGQSWTAYDLPVPEGVEADLVSMMGVSCGGPDSCMAVGNEFDKSKFEAGEYSRVNLFVDHWDGEQWSTELVPMPEGVDEARFDGISCPSAEWCMLIGPDASRVWDGDEWSLGPVPTPPEGVGSNLGRLSCPMPDACVVTIGGGPEPAIATWDGESWASEIIPLTFEPWISLLFGITNLSCTAVDACIAVFPAREEGEGMINIYAAHLDGEEWTFEELPAPPNAIDVPVTRLSCSAADSCVTLNWVETSTAAFVVFEAWDGVQWSVGSTSNPGWPQFLGANAVSCAPGAERHCTFLMSTAEESVQRLRSSPVATTEGASEVGLEVATLNATVNPEGYETTYQLEYVEQTDFEASGYENATSVPTSPKGIGSGTSKVEVSEEVAGLKANRRYHFRVKASNSAGTTYGEDSTFATPAAVFAFEVSEQGTGEGQFSSYVPDLAVDPEGDVWVTDFYHDRVQQFNSSGEYLSQFGETGSGDGQLVEPTGIAVDSEGNVWVADTGNDRVQQFNSSGEYLSQFGETGSGDGQFDHPFGIAVDPEGDIWVSDPLASRVQQFNSSGEYLSQFGIAGSAGGQFQGAVGVAIDPEGVIWVVDQGNDRVQQFNSSGEYLSQFGATGSGDGQFRSPADIAIDSEGDLWVTDSVNERVQKFNSSGEYLGQFGEYGSEEGQLYLPEGIAVDEDDNIWVADFKNPEVGRIHKWSQGAPLATTGVATDVGPHAATLNATVNPLGTETTYQLEYGETTAYGSKVPAEPKSLGAGEEALGVEETIEGLSPRTTYHYRVVTESAAGTTYGKDETFTTTKWILASPAQPEEGEEPEGFVPNSLTGSSCVSETECVAVGRYWSPAEATAALAEHREGDEWQILSTPAPEGATESRLESVSCASASECVAVGSYTDSEGTLRTLAERYDGEKWSLLSTPDPEAALQSRLESVSCVSATDCTAVGYYKTGPGAFSTLVERYDGEGWSIVSSPNPEGEASYLYGVSCATATECWAVGKSGAGAIAIGYDGEKWSLAEVPEPPKELRDVSCPSTGFCLAVGAGEARRYDGSSWSAAPSLVQPPEATGIVTSAVSCASATACIAAGSWLAEGGRQVPLAEGWDGAEWAVEGTVDPYGAIEGATEVSLFESVSCATALSCLATGAYATGSGTKVLAEVRVPDRAVYLSGEASEEESKQPRLESESYPRNVEGPGLSEFLTNKGTFSCKSTSLAGTLAAAAAQLDLDGSFSECARGEENAASVHMNSCHFTLGVQNAGPPYQGEWAVACEEAGDAIEFKLTAFGLPCVKVYPQSGLEAVALANSGAEIESVDFGAELTGVEYEALAGLAGCSESGENETRTDGVLSGSGTLAGVE